MKNEARSAARWALALTLFGFVWFGLGGGPGRVDVSSGYQNGRLMGSLMPWILGVPIAFWAIGKARGGRDATAAYIAIGIIGLCFVVAVPTFLKQRGPTQDAMRAGQEMQAQVARATALFNQCTQTNGGRPCDSATIARLPGAAAARVRAASGCTTAGEICISDQPTGRRIEIVMRSIEAIGQVRLEMVATQAGTPSGVTCRAFDAGADKALLQKLCGSNTTVMIGSGAPAAPAGAAGVGTPVAPGALSTEPAPEGAQGALGSLPMQGA